MCHKNLLKILCLFFVYTVLFFIKEYKNNSKPVLHKPLESDGTNTEINFHFEPHKMLNVPQVENATLPQHFQQGYPLKLQGSKK